MICKELEYLQAVKEKYEIGLSWLARRLNENPAKSRVWTKQGLDYIFSTSKEISTSTFKEIKSLFDKHNYIMDIDKSIQSISEEIARINKESAELVIEGFKAVQDLKFTKEEKARILLEANDVLAQTKKLIEMVNAVNAK